MDTFNKNTTTTSSSNGKMGRRVSFGRKVERRMCTLRRCILRCWERILMCSSVGKPIRYHVLQHHPSSMSSAAPPEPPSSAVECGFELLNVSPAAALVHEGHRDYNIDIDHNVSSKDSDLVSLKISLLGDSQIGKTSFLAKYVGNETVGGGMQAEGLNFMDKTLNVKGARISYSLWELDGDEKFRNQIPVACEDSVAILIMFDLTSRVTLNGVIKWYQEARRWNQTAIPILVGTKFDDFIQLPLDLQWTIASQARAYAKALNATIFFSSATYNINVNKIFKFITAKLFDLSWTVERNLTVGEPIIDF